MIFPQVALLLVCLASAFGKKVIDCSANGAATIQWRPELTRDQKLDVLKARLGSCPPTSVSVEQDALLFSVWLQDCGFERAVSEGEVTYTNMLTYNLDAGLPPITEPVECVYRLNGTEMHEDTVKNGLVFTLELMNSDFNGPAPSTVFTIGSQVPIRAKVKQQELSPVQLYLQSCMLANSPDLTQSAKLHRLISDAGCLTESKEGNATFLARQVPSEISFYFQAFEFALGEQVFLHCDMAMWDFLSFGVDKKACQYFHDQNRWELLDDPAQSYICSCCESTCQNNFDSGIRVRQVLGPFTMVNSQPDSSAKYMFWPAGQGSRRVPVWAVALTVCLVLTLMAGAVAASYYLCYWRGGRLGYRPSRELLNKY